MILRDAPVTGMMGPPTIGVVPLLPEPQLPVLLTNVPPVISVAPDVLPSRVAPFKVIVLVLDVSASSPTPELLLKVLQLILTLPPVEIKAPPPPLPVTVPFPFAVTWSKETRFPVPELRAC